MAYAQQRGAALLPPLPEAPGGKGRNGSSFSQLCLLHKSPWGITEDTAGAEETHSPAKVPGSTGSASCCCETWIRGEFQLRISRINRRLQAAGGASQAGILQEKGSLSCNVQTSRCQKSGHRGGRKGCAHSAPSAALPRLPARSEAPARIWPRCWVGCGGSVPTLSGFFLPLLRGRCKI